MTFHSILFEKPTERSQEEPQRAPGCFPDLNLDQIINAVTTGRKEYRLTAFFSAPLTDVGAIQYRHEVMRDLENDQTLFDNIGTFAQSMVIVRRYLGLRNKLNFERHRQGWFLEAALVYCNALVCLARDLQDAKLKSRGLTAFRAFITGFVQSDSFKAFMAQSEKLKEELLRIHYCVRIKGHVVQVRKYEGEIDYSEKVRSTFEKFRQGTVRDYRARLGKRAGMNHVEAEIVDNVARLYPEIFAELERFSARHDPFLNETITAFDREIQFYVAYLEFITPLKQAGLPFCYPHLSTVDKEVYSYDSFDLALANKFVQEDRTVVGNDFHLQGEERIIIVSGPNQGGKTTFARMFGQLHYLASLGCPVPGRDAKLFLCDTIFTLFEKEEQIEDLRGKLQDDLFRIHRILKHATPQSLIVINEIFSSTTSGDAALLGKEIMARIMQLDALCVCVTFIDELASLSEKTVSMVSTVVPENPAVRTFKILRRPADGLSHAISIAEKHRLTFDQLMDRIPS